VMKKAIVFDFDGTIADSMDIIVGTVYAKAISYNFKTLTIKEIKDEFGKGTENLIQLLGVNKEKIPQLMEDVRSDLSQKIDTTLPIPGIIRVLKKLNNNNIVGIVTSNNKKTVEKFLEKYDVRVSFIYDKADLEGKAKIIIKMLSDRNMDKNETFYVGDEDRDIEAAKHAGIRSIAVTWGLNSKKYLARHNPNYLIDKPSDLLKII
jgi:HAD superfamily hydrolase (TIGR01549 family)